MFVKLDINDNIYELNIGHDETLLYILRERLEFTGVKQGCNTGHCGSCKVLVNGRDIKSCSIKASSLENKKIYTIESFATPDGLHPIQESFIEAGAVQCGYCIPGMIITTQALINRNSSPTDDEIRKAFKNNLCRCTGYIKIIDAVKLSYKKLGVKKYDK